METVAVPLDPLYTTIVPYLQVVVATIVTGILGWAATLLKQYTGITVEAKHREALQSALTNAAMRAIATQAEGRQLMTDNQLLAVGMEYVTQSVPDAVNYFGLGSDKLRILLEAKFGEIQIMR